MWAAHPIPFFPVPNKLNREVGLSSHCPVHSYPVPNKPYYNMVSVDIKHNARRRDQLPELRSCVEHIGVPGFSLSIPFFLRPQ